MTRLYFSKLLPLLVLLVLVVGFAATYFLQQIAFNTAHQIQQDNFNYQAREVVLRIMQRLAAYEQVLRGARGLFVASKSVERDKFHGYVDTLSLANHFPGIQGVGFLLIIPPQEKARHIEAIRVSHDEIQRLLQNLIGNAIKYRISGRTPEITVTSKIARNEWRLCVADNGVGIISGQIKRLFQVFQRLQLRDAYEGTGIGLALCRKIAEHHKGRIWAESAGEGQGSKFHVALPVLREKTISTGGISA